MANYVLENRKELKSRNYIRKADPKGDYWFDFSKGEMDKYKQRFGEEFNLIIAGNCLQEDDYYIIPYRRVSHIFTEGYFSNNNDERAPRWVGNVKNQRLKITNCPFAINVAPFYGNIELL